MHQHITEPLVPSEQQTNQGIFLKWISRMVGTVAMFVVCLAVCHFAELIHLRH